MKEFQNINYELMEKDKLEKLKIVVQNILNERHLFFIKKS